MTKYNIHIEAQRLAQDMAAGLVERYGSKQAALDSLSDDAHEIVDGHQWVIYHHHAAHLIANNGTDDGEDWVCDIHGSPPYEGCTTIGDIHERLAYGMLYLALVDALYEAVDALPVYAVGTNVPGYMPDNTPEVFSDWEAARNALLLMAEDDSADAADTPQGDELEHLVVAILMLREGSEFGATVAGRHYFLSQAA